MFKGTEDNQRELPITYDTNSKRKAILCIIIFAKYCQTLQQEFTVKLLKCLSVYNFIRITKLVSYKTHITHPSCIFVST